MLDKALAKSRDKKLIKKGYKKINLDFTDEELGKIARMAHKLDITINDFVVYSIENYLKKHNLLPSLPKERIIKEQEQRIIDVNMLKDLEQLIKIQKQDGNWNYDPYMHGLLNGMLLAESTVTNKKFIPYSAPKKWKYKTKIVNIKAKE